MKRSYLLLIVALGLSGCTEETTPSDLRERQEQALRDPMNYDGGADRTDISGGGMMEFKKDAFKRDMDSVFNP